MRAPDPPTKNLRVFGLIAGLVLSAFGARALGRAAGEVCLGLGVVSLALSALAPRLLARFYEGYLRLGRLVGRINNALLLALVFYGMVTPMGLVMRILGRDPMRRAAEPEAPSYRVDRRGRSGIDMRQQF